MHVLILDDELSIGRYLARTARAAGWSADAATCPDTFKEKLSAVPPDLVMLDLALGVSDGIEQLRHLRQANYANPIVLMSGFDSRVLETARQLGDSLGLSIAAVLRKPLRTEAVRGLLGKLNRGGDAQAGSPAAAPVAVARPPSSQPITPARIGEAIAAGELTIDLQPIVCAATLRVKRFEALVRWNHPERGRVPPNDFISVAEQDRGVIDALTMWVVGAAGAAHVRLRDAGFAVPVAVNVSGANLQSLDFPDRVMDALRAAGAPPGAVSFEITESAALRDPATIMDILARLRLKGFDLAIDDLGTGYSSLDALRRLPFCQLKIDRQFIADAERSAVSLSVVKSIVDLARNMKVRSVAEGVESWQTLEVLRGLGVDCVQGYVISRPLPQGRVVEWMAQWARRDGAQIPEQ